MAMRLTGMMSGMDTETIIQELVSAKRTKVDKQKKAQTKLSWKQDAWKELNTKLKNLQSKFINNMRFSNAYSKKVTKVSNSNAVSILTGEDAVNSVQSLEIESLAKTAYLTGDNLARYAGEEYTATTKLSELKDASGNQLFATGNSGSFDIKVGDQAAVTVNVTDETTISDVLNQLKDAGLNANFDAKTQRFYVSAKESGKDNNFTITANDADGAVALNALGLTGGDSHMANGDDAVIYLNGAKFTSNTNTFEINGLTITANSVTQPGEVITVTTQQDTDGIYDMVKNFLKEYNAVINEMDKLYNADSAKGYEPLTSDEKDSMSETEIKEWETKIKDSLLRRDSNLSSISSALREVMSAGAEVNGKQMYLFDFGIDTLGYFLSSDNEKNAYHIDGDPDDSDTSGNADKLKSMISSDPDTVISFFMQLSRNLYDKMSDLSAGVQDYRSFGNFYDDKKMKSDYDSYTTKIAELEEKLNAYEDKWYKKFSAMETALAKMQSNVSAVTSLLGG